MNSNGQFLLYDALLAFLILFVVLACVVFVVGEEDDTSLDSNPALDRLALLASVRLHDMNLLVACSKGDSTACEFVCDVLMEDSFVLKDLTLNKILVNKRGGDYVDAFSARKVVEGHEYELTLYV